MTKPATRICAECRTSFEPRGGLVLGLAVYLVTYGGVAAIAEVAHMATTPTVLLYGSGIVLGWATERWAVARHRASCPACGSRRTVPMDTPAGAALTPPPSPAVDLIARPPLPAGAAGGGSPTAPRKGFQPEAAGLKGTVLVLGLFGLLIVSGYVTREVTERVEAYRHRPLTAAEARTELTDLARERQGLAVEADAAARRLDDAAMHDLERRVQEVDQRCEDVQRRAPKDLWGDNTSPRPVGATGAGSPGR